MRLLAIILFFSLFLPSCTKKQLLGPRKVTAVGHFDYNVGTGNLTKTHYLDGDDQIFTIKLLPNHKLGGDISGTWKESGAQQLLFVEGDFGPSSPLPIDHGFYDTRDEVLVPDINGAVVDMRSYAKDVYFIAVSHGALNGIEFYRYFVFE